MHALGVIGAVFFGTAPRASRHMAAPWRLSSNGAEPSIAAVAVGVPAAQPQDEKSALLGPLPWEPGEVVRYMNLLHSATFTNTEAERGFFKLLYFYGTCSDEQHRPAMLFLIEKASYGHSSRLIQKHARRLLGDLGWANLYPDEYDFDSVRSDASPQVFSDDEDLPEAEETDGDERPSKRMKSGNREWELFGVVRRVGAAVLSVLTMAGE